tara:strand:- start:1042 stop:1326 length:285 start_codon:yes stop_codon:yes gene_type:complete
MSNIKYKELSDLRKKAKPLRPVRIAEPSWNTMCETAQEDQLISTLENYGITIEKIAAPKKKAVKKEEKAESKPKKKKAATKSKATSSKGKKQKR